MTHSFPADDATASPEAQPPDWPAAWLLMPLSHLVCLFPCHTLDDFPVHLRGQDATGLLAAWSGLWHPALIAQSRGVPVWRRSDDPGYEFEGRLFAVPAVSEPHLPLGWRDQAQVAGALVLAPTTDRAAFVGRALKLAGIGSPAWALAAGAASAATGTTDGARNGAADGASGGVTDVERLKTLERHFFALGYCRLQVELLTRRMRYTSTIDEGRLSMEAVAAAEAWAQGDASLARHHLQAAFDLLLAARQYFYPVDSYLIDLVLVWPTTAGPRLRAELSTERPINVLLTGETIETLSQTEPSTLAALQDAVAQGRACLVGGEWDESELPLVQPEQWLDSFRAGRQAFERHLGTAPTIYGRRRAGLGPGVPQILSRLNFQGAVHATLDDGRIPHGNRAKIRWEGQGMSSLDAVSAWPRDAGEIETLLGLSAALGETMDHDHVATLLLVRWPGGGVDAWQDLINASSYAPVLGHWITLRDYFSNTDSPGQIATFAADRYRMPYLEQAAQRRQSDPVSRGQDARRGSIAATCRAAVELMSDLITGSVAEAPADHSATAIAGSVTRFAQALPRGTGDAESALVVVNPLLHARQMLVDGSAPRETEHPPRPVAVPVPALGFARYTAEQLAALAPQRPVTVGEWSLANEHLQVMIHPETGGIQAIYDDRHRGNRLSQQIAVREESAPPPPGGVWREPEWVYSTMRATSITIQAAGPWLGEIESRGALVSSTGARLADFVQRTRLVAGSRVVELRIELSPVESLADDPWSSYAAVRWAWSHDDYRWFRGVGLVREATSLDRIEAADYLELESDTGTITLLCSGLPYHVRASNRRLDSLLQVRGETQTIQRLAAGFDLANPAASALEFDAPPCSHWECAPPLARTSSGWLFRLSRTNIVATSWSPLCGNDSPNPRGFRVRLLETLGQAGQVVLQAFRPVIEARQVDFSGQPLVQLRLDDGKILVDVAAGEWLEIEALWSE